MTKAHTDKLTEYSELPGLARATSIQFSSLSRNSSLIVLADYRTAAKITSYSFRSESHSQFIQAKMKFFFFPI